jgi:hypothetical protein
MNYSITSSSRFIVILFISFYIKVCSGDTLTFRQPEFLFKPVVNNSFLYISNSGFNASILKLNKKYTTGKNSVSLISAKEKNYFVEDESIICSDNSLFPQDLINIRYPFIEIKYNVIPYLNSEFFLKVLYILNKVNFKMRISDAMRTEKNQLRYKRRGWSSRESSPHLTGIAVDLSSYFSRDMRDKIKATAEKIGLRFLEHGGRGNRHIHLEDENKWLRIKNKDVESISDSLNAKIKSEKTYRKVTEDGKENSDIGEMISFSFTCSKPTIYKFIFKNIFDENFAELTSGIFEQGNNSFGLKYDFLKKGFYKVWVYENNKCIRENYLFRF